jgi:hypothetical protein
MASPMSSPSAPPRDSPLSLVPPLTAPPNTPPPIDTLRADLDHASGMRADWFRAAQWAAHLPEEYRPESWANALRESAEQDTEFGPPPPVDHLAGPRALESPLGDIDITATTVSGFVSLLNGAASVGESDDPRFAMSLHGTIASHTEPHREAWASDHSAIAQVRNLWARLAIVRARAQERGQRCAASALGAATDALVTSGRGGERTRDDQ